MTNQAYRWNSLDYAQHSSAQFEWAKELINKFKLEGDEAVLDIGCGDGKVSAALAACVPRGVVIGIDNSEEMIALARENFQAATYPNLSFKVMDARHLTFSGQFDVAFSNASLHWVPEQFAVLEGVKKSLKKGGRLLFQMGGKGNASEILAVLDEIVKRCIWCDYFKDFTFPYAFLSADDYSVLMQKAGLEPIRVELVPKDMQQQGSGGLAGWVRTTWLPYTHRVPESLREQFILELVDSYLDRHPLDIHGFAHVPMVRLEVEATLA